DGNNYDFTVAEFGYGFTAPTGTASLTEVSNGFNLGSIGLAGLGMNTFLTAQSFMAANNGAYQVVSGDFNGDGIPDLAVTDINDNTVSVLLGNGDGTFQLRKTFAVDHSPWGI